MGRHITPKRVEEVLEVAKAKGVKSGAFQIDGERFEFNYTSTPTNAPNEWDDVLGEN